MAIRFSPSPGTFYVSLRGDTSAHLRADFDTYLLAAGWSVDRTVTNGKIYILQSPQGLFAKCRIQDTGRAIFLGPHVLDIQFMSLDETRLGFQHDLPYGESYISAHGYKMHVGPCQIFVKLLNSAWDYHDGTRVYNVAGGIPAIPDLPDTACSVPGAPEVTELWWSNGGGEINRGNKSNFRTSRYCYVCYSTCKNGVLYVSPGTSDSPIGIDSYENSPLQLMAMTTTANTDFWYYIFWTTTSYHTDRPFNLDAMLLFRFKTFGQLWDAFTKSVYTALDEEITTTEVGLDGSPFVATWESYNYDLPDDNKGGGGTWFSTLYLLKGMSPDPYTGGGGGGGGASNYAY